MKVISLDGYNSSSLDERVARRFASTMESDVLDQVLLCIEVKNETGRNYVSLDREDYTCYPDEMELLL